MLKLLSGFRQKCRACELRRIEEFDVASRNFVLTRHFDVVTISESRKPLTRQISRKVRSVMKATYSSLGGRFHPLVGFDE